MRCPKGIIAMSASMMMMSSRFTMTPKGPRRDGFFLPHLKVSTVVFVPLSTAYPAQGHGGLDPS